MHAVGREGDAEGHIRVAGAADHFVAPRRVGVRRIKKYTAAVRAFEDKVVGLAACKLHQAEVGLFPMDAVARGRMADAHLTLARLVAHLAALLRRCGTHYRVHDEGAVPAAVNAIADVQRHIGVEIVKAHLPGPVLLEERIARMLLHRAESEPEPGGFVHDARVQQQIACADRCGGVRSGDVQQRANGEHPAQQECPRDQCGSKAGCSECVIHGVRSTSAPSVHFTTGRA